MMMKLLNMEQVFYATNMVSVPQKTSGLSLSGLIPSQPDHNEIFQDLLSSSNELGSFETIQDAELPFEEMDTIAEIEGCEELPSLSESFSYEKTQQLIEEMDEFMKEQQKELQGQQEQTHFEENNYPLLPSSPLPDSLSHPFSSNISTDPVADNETKEAIQMLDALIQSDIQWNEQSLHEEPIPSLGTPDLLSMLSFDSFSESPSQSPCSSLSPASSLTMELSPPASVLSSTSSSSASELKSKVAHHQFSSKSSGSGGRVKKLTIKDKKERKKWQNVEAARRYRDKKRALVHEHLQEAKHLEDRNLDLKSQLRGVENELSTMKKLMIELGMIKVCKT